MTATARPLHQGRQVIVVETELGDDAGRLVAKATPDAGRARPGPVSLAGPSI